MTWRPAYARKSDILQLGVYGIVSDWFSGDVLGKVGNGVLCIVMHANGVLK